MHPGHLTLEVQVHRSVVVLAILLLGCGESSTPKQLARLQIVPGSMLFAAPGETRTLAVRGFDADGKDVPVRGDVTWTSSHPDIVSVSDAAAATSVAALGSSQIVAQVGELRSEPIVAFVAQLHPGTLLVDDAQIASDYSQTQETPAQFQVLLAGIEAPAPGTIVLGRESKPLVGRVAAAVASDTGTLVTLDVIHLGQAVVALSIDETFALPRTGPITVNTDETMARTAFAAEDDEPPGPFTYKFNWGALTCEATGMPKISLGAGLTLTLEPDVDLDYKFEVKDGAVEAVRMVGKGSMKLGAEAAIELTGAFAVKFVCEREIAKSVIPVGGIVAFIIAPTVSFGAGFEVEAAIELVAGKLGAKGEVAVEVTAGLEYTRAGGLSPVSGFTPSATGEPIVEVPDSFTPSFKLTGKPLLFLKFNGEFFPYLPGKGKALELVVADVGLEAELDYSSMTQQFQDPGYRSTYGVKVVSSLGFGEAITELLEALGGVFEISPPTLTYELPLDEAPKGVDMDPFTITPSTSFDKGETAMFTVKLDPNTLKFFVFDNVVTVELYRYESTVGLTPFKTLAHQGGGVYTATWETTDNDIGNYTFVAFVKDWVLGDNVGTPLLEVDDDATMKVTVRDPGNPAPALTGNWRLRTGYLTCDTTSYTDMVLYPNGAAVSDDFYEESQDCTSAGGETYRVGRYAWEGTADQVQLRLCEYDSAEAGDELVWDLTWNPQTNRFEGVQSRGINWPYGQDYKACLTRLNDVDFTGTCVAAACPRADTTCTAANGTTGGYPGVALYCGCNPSACDECRLGPAPWELAYTPTCY